MRLTKSSKTSKSSPLNGSALDKGFARIKSSMHFKWDEGATTIFLVAVGVATAVMVDAAVRSRKLAEVAAANAPSIVIVDAANKVKLPNHVGERVAVTGMLVDHEMQVHSLQRVAISCNQEA